MKRFLLIPFMCINILCVDQNMNVHVDVSSGTNHAKVGLLIGILNDRESYAHDIAKVLKKDLSFSGQFNVAMQKFKQVPSKKELFSLFQRGYPLVLFINNNQKNNAIEWRLYDTLQSNMVGGKQYVKKGALPRGWAHNIADAVWPVLTDQEGFFSTKIAFCKEAKTPTNNRITHICIADYDGSNQQALVEIPTITVAPRWNHDKKNPLVFYSEYTNSNVRLMSVGMNKKRKISSDFDGVNMVPAFSGDGKKVVYCASRGGGKCQLYFYEKGAFKKITHNNGNNVSPSMSIDGRKVFYCSDYQTGRPQIYMYDMKKHKQTRLTKGGYCASPSYCTKKNKVVYSKIVRGTMQLFLCDLNDYSHTQLTRGAGNKEECSWSPCGNYVMYSVENRGKSRIVMHNLLTGNKKYISPATVNCCFPAWSPRYSQFPALISA